MDKSTYERMYRRMRNVSCGLMITDGEVLLLERPTNHDIWEIPKGIFDYGVDANYTEGAVRECFEETGMDLSELGAEFIGTFIYLRHKDLAVSKVRVSKNFLDKNLPTLYCSSLFKDVDGVMKPEICEYRIATFQEAYMLCLPEMAAIIQEIKEHYLG